MNNLKKILAGFALAGVIAMNPVSADTASPLPSTMAWTSYPTSSANYAQLLALGNVLKKKFNVSVRVLPGDNDVSRMTPLRTGRVDLCGCGIASYYASEGVLLFADAAWGPQPVRVIRTSIADFGMGLVVAGDLEVKTPADLKGKKIAWVRGAPSLNLGTEAYLAFGGLSWDDVERVEFPGYNRSFDGIIQGLADAAFTMTSAPAPEQVAASPRGITWPELSPDDEEGWARMKNVAPYFQSHEVTSAAGGVVNKDHPHAFASYPYPVMVATRNYDSDIVYNLIKVIHEDYDEYKNDAPGATGYGIDSQNMFWVIPFHDAVVRYYKDIGIWTDEMQAHQDQLVRRQALLIKTWNAFVDDNPPSDQDQFREAWMQARATALEAEDMNPVFY